MPSNLQARTVTGIAVRSAEASLMVMEWPERQRGASPAFKALHVTSAALRIVLSATVAFGWPRSGDAHLPGPVGAWSDGVLHRAGV